MDREISLRSAHLRRTLRGNDNRVLFYLPHKFAFISIIHCLLFSFVLYAQYPQVHPGADILLSDSLHLIEGKRIALIANHTSLLSNGVHLADTLVRIPTVQLKKIFSPEHGFRGMHSAGAAVENSIDKKTNVPVISLYGAVKKPTGEMLRDVDLLVYDVQDAGTRCYTYISTMTYCMEAASENNIPFLVLDRPNLLTGNHVEGPIRENNLTSFISLLPVPVIYGMTIGELARMINREGWMNQKMRCDLTIIPMENWKRIFRYDETGLAWLSPSPNLKTLRTAIIYPGTCLIEGTNISEGRGTDHPFEYIGAPFLDGDKLSAELQSRHLPGVQFSKIEFTPASIPSAAPSPKFENEKCFGVNIEVTDRKIFSPVATSIHLLDVIIRQAGKNIVFNSQFDYLTGRRDIRASLQQGRPVSEIIRSWKKDETDFTKLRKKYLLYN